MLENFLNQLSTKEATVIYEFLEIDRNKKGLTEERRLKYITGLRKLLSFLSDKSIFSLDQNDVDILFCQIKGYQKWSPMTKRDHWFMIKGFLKYVNSGLTFDGYKLSRKKKQHLPEDILSEEEFQKVKESAQTFREKALISLLCESGCRAGEIVNLRVKDVVFDDFGAVIRVDGKTGQRRIRLIQSVPFLSIYLQEHRYREDPLAPLFYRIDKHIKMSLSYVTINEIVKDCARRAGIKKRIFTHLFRHSRATHLAKHLTEQELKIYFGWVGDSKMAGTYVHLSGKDVEDKILQINGITPVNTTGNSLLKTKHCVRCTMTNDSAATYCSRCGMILDEKEAFKAKDVNPDAEFQTFLKEMYGRWKEMRMTDTKAF
ncbi:MAG: tyrosine-type recombinase/integrase [Candidatus Aenigmarchaeota archaeon]|nr:tyrosine-type recombinase/integrase [Candidatus Aenigmarchaeota archaeon]